MRDLTRPLELVEKIMLENRSGRAWIALSIGGCGMLAHASIGRHLRAHGEERGIALKFAYQVLHMLGTVPADERPPTPQILVDAAAATIDDPEHVCLLCTTWQSVPGGVEICSVGATSVLVFEDDCIKEVVTRHTVSEILRLRGEPMSDLPGAQGVPTHALEGRSSQTACRVDDVRVAIVPLKPSTIVAVIEDWRLASDIKRRAVPGDRLPAFIEAWDPPGKKIRTSVLISL